MRTTLLTCRPKIWTTDLVQRTSQLQFQLQRSSIPWTTRTLQRRTMAGIARSDILKGKYPAKTHARKVADWIVKHGAAREGILYLEAQKGRLNEDNDQEAFFRQRRYFFYFSGVALPDCYVTYNLATEKLTLFIPPVDPEDVIWSGLPLQPKEALEKYDVDEVLTSDQVNPALAEWGNSSQTIYAIDSQIADHITFLNFTNKNFDLLKPAIDTCRVVKTPYELALIKHANLVSNAGHVAVLKAARHATNEQELEAIFYKNAMERGCKTLAYSAILASGTNAATLHYVKNNEPLKGRLNLLIDAGAEADCYASDITRTFPLSGKFTTESRAIYDIVLQMQLECISKLRAGILWDDVHAHAHRIAIAGLLKLGILRNGSVEDIFSARTSVAFFPHGLGHYLGMDTHDTGGNADYGDADPMFRYLRTRGMVAEGSVITVEPGVYFCRFIITPYLKDPKHSQYIDEQVLERYWDVGGVRIEDDLYVTAEGYENLTVTPKSVEDMEALINS